MSRLKFTCLEILVMVALLWLRPSIGFAKNPAQMLPYACEGDDSSKITVAVLPGWDHRTFDWPEIGDTPFEVCRYELAGGWDDPQITAMHDELDRLLASRSRVIVVGYSMSAPFALEMLDTWERPNIEPGVLARIELLLLAPAVEINPALRPAVASQARRWRHAWVTHFESGVLRRDYLPEWSDLLDRMIVVLAMNDTVVNNDGISATVRARLGEHVVEVDGTRHLQLRNAKIVGPLVALLAGRQESRALR
jgi:pimeloyl-ACP methyl ester carboxylesterase